MAQTNINIRMDEDLKRQFEALCQNIGMSMTTAFTIFAKKAVRENAIPFVVSAYKDPPTISLTEEELDRLLIRVLLKKEEWDAQAKETDSSVEDFIPDDEITEIEE